MANQLMGGGDETKMHLLAGFGARSDEWGGAGARGAASFAGAQARYLMQAAAVVWDFAVSSGRTVLRRMIERRVD